MSSNSFLVAFLGFSVYSTMSSLNSDNFISFFPFWIILFLFFFLIAVARSSNTTMNKSVEKGHPTLVVELREIFSVFYCLI